MKSINLIQEYLKLTKICAATDYEDKSSVQKHNRSVDKMYEIVRKIRDENTLESVEDFVKLLDIMEYKTNVWAAIHLLEEIQVDNSNEAKALYIIEQVAYGTSADAMGYRLWLENYNKL